mgnify:CR=1 FL=1
MSSISKSATKTILVSLALLSASLAHSAVIDFDLSGTGSSVNGFGRDGIYVGPNFNGSNAWKPQFNWTFNDVKLSVDDVTGVGTIAGTMNHQLDNSIWTINTILNDLVVRTGTWKDMNIVRNDYNSATDDLSTILSAMVPGTGVEWKSLSTTISNGSTKTSLTGFAMPNIGHANVAELMWFDNFIGSDVKGLIFDAWYKGFDAQGNALVGDSKALATVPIPAAAFLFAPAFLGFLGLRRKAKQA